LKIATRINGFRTPMVHHVTMTQPLHIDDDLPPLTSADILAAFGDEGIDIPVELLARPEAKSTNPFVVVDAVLDLQDHLPQSQMVNMLLNMLEAPAEIDMSDVWDSQHHDKAHDAPDFMLHDTPDLAQ
jgi:hypothetical protein